MQASMARKITSLDEITLTTKTFKIEAMIVEKSIPRMTATRLSSYQRLMLQDIQGTKMQATIFGNDIQVLGKTLKLHQTYRITNPGVSRTPEAYRFLPHPCQLSINARTPVEHIQIDGFTARTLKYNFTPISALNQINDSDTQIDVLFAVLEVGSRRQANASTVTNVRIIDQSFEQIMISLWDLFVDYEAPAMASMPDRFPILIGHRLKTSTFYGLTLATRPTSSFVFEPQIPEAMALQAWCNENAGKIRELPPLAAMETSVPQLRPPDADVTKIANIPTTVTKPELFNVHGVAELTNFNQSFYYVTCSNCKKASDAYGDAEYWCNHCEQRVLAVPKLKFNITIKDPSATIEATIFQEAAEQFYGITQTILSENLDEQRLSFPLLQQLAEPKECTVTLKVAMYSYRGSTQHRITVQTIAEESTDEDPHQASKRTHLSLEGPAKRTKTQHDEEASASSTSEPNAAPITNPPLVTTGNRSSPEITESNE